VYSKVPFDANTTVPFIGLLKLSNKDPCRKINRSLSHPMQQVYRKVLYKRHFQLAD
jgi:hypothetical protein